MEQTHQVLTSTNIYSALAEDETCENFESTYLWTSLIAALLGK